MELDSIETLNLLLNNILRCLLVAGFAYFMRTKIYLHYDEHLAHQVNSRSLYSATRQDVQIRDLVSVIYGADDAACYTRTNAVLSFRNGGRK